MKRRRRQSAEDRALAQAKRMIALAKSEGCAHFKFGEFEVTFGPVGEPHDACGFEVSPTPPDEYYEAKRNV